MGRKICRWLLSLGLLGCLTAQAGSPVWAIRGEHNTVYLAGSVHLLKAEDAHLPAAFDRAYAGSKSLVMELNLDEVNPLDAAAWMLENGAMPEGMTLRKKIGDARYQRVVTEATRLGLAPELLDMFQPWVVGLQLLELQYAQLGYQADMGVEQQLNARAKTDGKSIQGLETMSEQLGVLGNMSDEDQAHFLDMTVTEMHDVGGETQTVIGAWKSGDTQRLASLMGDEYKSFPALYQTLVADRNKHWVPQIEKLLRDNENYFVVVGALHLVGDGGLLELMRHDGFKPEQLN